MGHDGNTCNRRQRRHANAQLSEKVIASLTASGELQSVMSAEDEACAIPTDLTTLCL